VIAELDARIAEFREQFRVAQQEIAKVIVGSEEIVDGVLMALLARGHVLLEGVPGLGKTKLVQTLGQALDLEFSRIQFTPDLMPADVTGTHIVQEDGRGQKSLRFQRGPLFANLILADEINRATPKTQSALLEAMQEETVTVGKDTYALAPPFFVLATQNPLEMEGTYPLPEAQLDRFFMKLTVGYPSVRNMHTILDRTTRVEEPEPEVVLRGPDIMKMRETVLSVPIARPVQDYAVRLVLSTHPDRHEAHEATRRYVRYGASPRGAQALVLGGKIRAILENRVHVSTSDIETVALAVLRHRILLNFEGEAERIDPDTILSQIVRDTPRTETTQGANQ
jgi:MoxR-like ATPase